MKPSQPQPKRNVFERLYDKQLDADQVAEMRYNLTGYLRVLVEMDKQYQEYLKQQKQEGNLNANDS
jgi:hypothetical protein